MEKSTNIGVWKWIPQEDNFVWSDNLYKIYATKKSAFDCTLEAYLQFFPEENREEIKSRFLLALNSKSSFSINQSIFLPDGSTKQIKIWGAAVEDAEGKRTELIGSCLDVSEHLKSLTRDIEKKMFVSEDKFYKAFHINPTPVAIINLKTGKVVDVNDRFEQLLDLNKAEIIDQNIDKLHFWKEKAEKQKFIDKLIKSGRVEQYETLIQTHYSELKNIVISGEIIEIEKEKAALLMIFDVTERKKAENDLITLTENLRKTNEELRQFAFITSHNFRGPVINIQSLLEFYDKSKEVDPGNKEIVDHIEKSVKQLNNTLQDLIELVSVKEGESKGSRSIKFKTVIDSVLRNLDKPIRETEAKIELSLKVEKLKIKKPILESIIYNLISNALKYSQIDRKPVIRIKTSLTKNHIRLEVQDNGIGIDLEKYRNKLFGLYQRLHQSGEGKGLGLYIIKTQVENLGGKIEVNSKVGSGTNFLVYFPN